MEILTCAEFDTLVALEEQGRGQWPVEHLQKLTALDLIQAAEGGYRVTEAGYAYLAPHRVRRAILLAAGFGSRMQPVTKEIPKPLVKVHGVALIETLLTALLEKGIDDITIVIGYLHEKFADLRQKYPQVKFLLNAHYASENNISSALLVKDLYANAYVMDADLYLQNRDIIRRYEYGTNYLGIPVAATEDWCLKQEKGKVVAMVQGGTNTHLMVGISFWTEADQRHFAEDIVALHNTEQGKQMYWDDVALTAFNEHYHIRVRECDPEDVIELDSLAELAAMDNSYARYLE